MTRVSRNHFERTFGKTWQKSSTSRAEARQRLQSNQLSGDAQDKPSPRFAHFLTSRNRARTRFVLIHWQIREGRIWLVTVEPITRRLCCFVMERSMSKEAAGSERLNQSREDTTSKLRDSDHPASEISDQIRKATEQTGQIASDVAETLGADLK